MHGSSVGDFSLPGTPNMHSTAPAERTPSWQSQRRNTLRSSRLSMASSRHSAMPPAQEAPREESRRRPSTAASAQSQRKWWRIRFFRGMYQDVKRRAPYYWSDWTDAWDYRIVPATVYMYFAKYELQLVSNTPGSTRAGFSVIYSVL